MTGRRWPVCYHVAGHGLARWYLGKVPDSLHVLTPQQLHSGECITDRLGRILGSEGIAHGPPIGPSPTLTAAHVEKMKFPLPALRTEFFANARREAGMGLLYDLAGPAAQARHENCPLDDVMASADDDADNHAFTLRIWFAGDAPDAAGLARAQVEALVQSAPGWRAVEALAGQLHASGEVDGAECARMCSAAYGVERHPGLQAALEAWPYRPASMQAGWLPGGAV